MVSISQLTKQVLLVVLGLFFPVAAFADLPLNSGLLDQIDNQFLAVTQTWLPVIFKEASWLFWTLALISMVWTFGQMAIKRAEMGEIFAELVRFIMFVGFFWWLLKNGPEFASMITNSLAQLAGKASGTNFKSPSSVIDIGFQFLKLIWGNFSWSITGIANTIIGAIIGIVTLIILASIAINLMILYIMANFLMYAGVIILGFGGAKWTSDMAINYYRRILAIGIEIFALVLVIGIGKGLLNNFYTLAGNNPGIMQEASFLIAAFALYLISQKIPPALASLIPGGGPSPAISPTNLIAAGAGAAAGVATGFGAAKAAGIALGGVGKMAAATAAAVNKQGGHAGFASMAAGVAKELGKAAGGTTSSVKNAINNSLGGRVASHISRNNKSAGPTFMDSGDD